MMVVLLLIGSKEFGGYGLLLYGWDMLVVVVILLVFYFWGVNIGYWI